MLTAGLRRERELGLSGFQVASNKTGILHSEQYCDLGGSFYLEQEGKLVNNTTWLLQDAGILRRAEDGRLEAAWIGELAAKTSHPVEFVHVANNIPRFEQWDRSPATLSLAAQTAKIMSELDQDNDRVLSQGELNEDAELRGSFVRGDRDGNGEWDMEELRLRCRDARAGEVSLGQLVELASRGLLLRPGDTRLIGWSDQTLPARTVSPAASQVNSRTLFLVHLKFGRLPDPEPDRNCWADIEDTKPLDLLNLEREDTRAVVTVPDDEEGTP